MTYNELLKLKLRGNIVGVSFFLLISTFLAAIKIYNLYFAEVTLIDINSKLLVGDYIVLILFAMGVIALLLSIFLYKKFDNYYPQTQIILFMGIGVFFLPYTIILAVIGIMKYIEKNKFKKAFFVTSILSLLLLAIVSSVTVTKLKAIEPEYTSSYYFEAEYVIDDGNSVSVVVWAYAKNNEITLVTMDAIINDDLVDRDLVRGEFYRMSIVGTPSSGGAPTCLNFPYDEELDNHEESCEVTKFVGIYENLDLNHFAQFTEFYLEYGYMSIDGALIIDNGVTMQVTAQTYKENMYQED